MKPSIVLLSLLLTISIALVGCHRARRSVLAQPDLPSPSEALGQPRCAVVHGADKPLVIEWPAADRADLEVAARRGVVAVRYEGCSMEILERCEVPGAYHYSGLHPKRESVRIRDLDELYAKLPLGAASLEAVLGRSGALDVRIVVVGRHDADTVPPRRAELGPGCDGATHVLTGLTVGAFAVEAAASTSAEAAAKLAAAGVGAGHHAVRERLAADGDLAQCEHGSRYTAPEACSSLLRVEATPIEGAHVARVPVEAQLADATPLAADATASRVRRRAAAWRAVGGTAAVLSAASLGGTIGGIIMRAEANDQPVWEEPTPDDVSRSRTGTALIAGSIASVVGFGVLAYVAFAQARLAGPGSLSRRDTPRVGIAPALGNGAGVVVGAIF